MKKVILFLLFLNILSCSDSNKQVSFSSISNTGAKIYESDLDLFLEKTMDSLKIPGLSIAVINNSKVVYHRAIGISNIETKERINNNSIFEAASISKPVFAYFTMKMAEKGVIDLDRPLSFYLPDSDMEGDSRYKQVTAKMVLNHTSGFPNWRWFEPAPDSLNIPRGEFYMKAEPGNFTYSGEGYQYLARVLAHNNFVNMYDLAEIFENEVSKPLGMTHAYFVWNDFLYDNKAFGHKNDGLDGRAWGAGLPHQHSKILNAAGGLHTESLSYAKFLIGLMNKKGLDDSSFDLLLSEQTLLPETHRFYLNENTVAWSLGLAIEDYKGQRYFKHGGNNGGFMSGFLIEKENKNGYVYFINCDKGKSFDKQLRKILMN